MAIKRTDQNITQLRQEAEAQLAHGAPKTDGPSHPAILLHELQVHQIELEMQNDELRRAQVALEESRDRYVDLYEFAPVGYLTITREGVISEINLTGAKLLGAERNKLLRRRFGSFVAPEHRDRWNRLFADILQQKGVKSCELALENADGKRLQAWLDCLYLAKDGEPPMVRTMLTDITSLRQAEEAMREWQTFVECASWGMSIGDIENRIIRLVNPAYARMHGYTVEELRNIKADALYAPESRASLAYYVECVRKDGHHSFECVRLRKNGSTFHAVADISMVEGVDGKTTAMTSVKDITEHKQAEALVQQFGSLLQGSFNEIYTFDADSLHFLLTSEGAEKNLGYSSDELNQLTPLDLKPLFTQDSFERLVAPLRSGEQSSLSFETVHRRKNGTTYPVEAYLQFMDGSHPVFLAIVQDITERKRDDELLRKSSEEIADIYNHSPCGYHTLDKDGAILMINATELAWLGYTRDEVIGKMKWTDLLTPTGLQTFRETFPQFMEQGFVRDIEAGIIRKDGTVFTGLINAIAICDPDGNFVMSRSTVTDITGRKRAEQKLRDLTAHLQSVREEEKTSIAREIHDDLGGTLTALKIEAYWLAEGLSANKETTTLLGHTGEMSQLIDNATGVLRRIITGLRPTILDDLGLLAALEWQAMQFHKHTGIECRVNCVGATNEARAKALDKPRSIALFRIAQEALTNVARHSGASRVEIEFFHSDTEVLMSIIDNGRGMMEVRADASTTFGMLGMSERVEQLGGKISFDTPPGGGFNVTVILPLPRTANKLEET